MSLPKSEDPGFSAYELQPGGKFGETVREIFTLGENTSSGLEIFYLVPARVSMDIQYDIVQPIENAQLAGRTIIHFPPSNDRRFPFKPVSARELGLNGADIAFVTAPFVEIHVPSFEALKEFLETELRDVTEIKRIILREGVSHDPRILDASVRPSIKRMEGKEKI